MIGCMFDKLKVISKDDLKEMNVICECDDGKTTSVKTEDLLNGKKRSCGCSWHNRKPRTKKPMVKIEDWEIMKNGQKLGVKCPNCGSES